MAPTSNACRGRSYGILAVETIVHLELLGHILHHTSLAGQLLAGGSSLFGGGGVGLNHSRDLIDTIGDLAEIDCLLLIALGKLLHSRNNVLDIAGYFIQGDSGLVGNAGALIYGGNGGGDQIGNALGGLSGLFKK